MGRESNEGCCATDILQEACLCPLEGVMDTLSRRWALSIIATLGQNGALRYNALLERLRGVSPSTLAARLKELEEAGLVSRKAFPEIPPRVEYSLTKEGSQLGEALKPLLEWTSTVGSRR
jgi:DNA-binding HxlR family transcriptional regulator